VEKVDGGDVVMLVFAGVPLRPTGHVQRSNYAVEDFPSDFFSDMS